MLFVSHGSFCHVAVSIAGRPHSCLCLIHNIFCSIALFYFCSGTILSAVNIFLILKRADPSNSHAGGSQGKEFIASTEMERGATC